MTHKSTPTQTAGYSLLEVLAAFVIMVTVLAVLLPGVSDLPNRSNHFRNQIQAADYAHSRLAALGISKRLEFGREQGDYQDRWVWVETVTPASVSSQNVNVAEVTVRILQRSDNSPLASISALRLMP